MLTKEQKKQVNKIYMNSLMHSNGWALLIIFIAFLPIIISYIYQSLIVEVNFNIVNYLSNGALVIISISLAAAAWVDLIFSKFSNQTNRFPELVLFLIIIFTVSIFLVCNATDEERVNIDTLSTYSIVLLFTSYIYAVILKAFIISKYKIDKLS